MWYMEKKLRFTLFACVKRNNNNKKKLCCIKRVKFPR